MRPSALAYSSLCLWTVASTKSKRESLGLEAEMTRLLPPLCSDCELIIAYFEVSARSILVSWFDLIMAQLSILKLLSSMLSQMETLMMS